MLFILLAFVLNLVFKMLYFLKGTHIQKNRRDHVEIK